MLDVGWAEILLLFGVALLIFGPEKLPKAAAQAGQMVRKLREMANSAQREIKDQGIDVSGITNDLKSVADLHPRRIIASTVKDVTAAGSTTARPAVGQPTVTDPSGSLPPAPSGPAQRLDPDAT